MNNKAPPLKPLGGSGRAEPSGALENSLSQHLLTLNRHTHSLVVLVRADSDLGDLVRPEALQTYTLPDGEDATGLWTLSPSLVQVRKQVTVSCSVVSDSL